MLNDRNGRRLDEAAELFVRALGDETAPEDWQAYQEWRNRSELNKQMLDSMEAFWQDLSKLDSVPWPTPDEIDRDQFDGSHPIPVQRSPERGRHRIAHGSGRRIIGYAQAKFFSLAAVVVVTVILSLFILDRKSADQSLDDVEWSYATKVAEHRTVTLDDGSELLLGGRSAVTVRYSPSARRVLIEGEGGEVYFKVAMDKLRPLVVEAGNMQAVALGTEFDVRMSPGVVKIAVVSGVVGVTFGRDALPDRQVSRDGAAPQEVRIWRYAELNGGEEIAHREVGNLTEVRRVNIDEVLAWRKGRLFYAGEPLATVIDDINRYATRQIEVTDSSVGKLLFSGAVRIDGIEDWLNGLQSAFPVQVTRSGGYFVLSAVSQM
jgi:ferric-dicitrate binding protein FerR (iron transport regulator)